MYEVFARILLFYIGVAYEFLTSPITTQLYPTAEFVDLSQFSIYSVDSTGASVPFNGFVSVNVEGSSPGAYSSGYHFTHCSHTACVFM